MLATLSIIGGVFVGLVGLLALIVVLGGRGRQPRGTAGGQQPPQWVAQSGRPHPDAWSPLSDTSTEIRAVR